MKKALGALIVLAGCASAPKVAPEPRRMVVAVPVADIRAKPSQHIGAYVQDPDQETQVEAGDPVIVRERRGRWALVECPLQPEYTHKNVWEGYPGWIEASLLTDDLSKEIIVTTDLRSESELRQEILTQASRHLGSPYLWGGRSLHSADYKKTLTGVDCSGLVNWSFRRIGRVVPRDAHEQFLRAQRMDPAKLQPGDLIFLAKRDRPERMVHVAFYAGNDEIIEAPQSGEAVRRMSGKKRFGKSIEQLNNGETVEDRVIYFGTLFVAQ